MIVPKKGLQQLENTSDTGHLVPYSKMGSPASIIFSGSMCKMRIPNPLGTTKFLLAWLTPWRPAFCVRASGSKLRFFAPWRGLYGRHLAKYGAIEPSLTHWISNRLATSPPGIFVDVGANLGWFALHAAQCDSVETVVAFEPDAFNAWLLDRNLTLNDIDNVIVNTCAVGARTGAIRFNRYKSSNSGRHSVLVDYGYGSRTVPMTDLDTALASLGLSGSRVLILKIDVEGYEPAVIAGAKQTLARTDAVITEFSPNLSQAGEPSLARMVGDLQAFGLTPHTLADNGQIAEIGTDELLSLQGQLDVIWLKTTHRGA